MAETYLSLGSNLGDRLGYLAYAVRALPQPVSCSRVYETDPVDSPEDSPKFLNACVCIEFAPHPQELLQLVMSIEAAAGRVRNGKNGPRTLDVDVVYVQNFASDDPMMTIPHPRAAQRAFVLAPLLDLSPAVASELNPEITGKLHLNFSRHEVEVYPGVYLYSAKLC